NDTLDEADESFTATLGSFTGGTSGGAQATAVDTITDDDPQPTVNAGSTSVTEGNAGTKTLPFAVALSNPSRQTITVNYATADGTATVGDGDYVAKSGTLTFPPGTLTQTVGVTINGDTKFESSETFSLNLSSPSNVTLGTNGTGTITNDDPAPTI